MEIPFRGIYEDRLFPSLMKRHLGWQRCVTDMVSSSLPGRVSWVENIKWNLTASPVYVINKGNLINSLSEHISVCYVTSVRMGSRCWGQWPVSYLRSVGGVPHKPDVLRPKDFKLWS